MMEKRVTFRGWLLPLLLIASAIATFLFRQATGEAGEGCFDRAVSPPTREGIVCGMAAHIDDEATRGSHGGNHSSANLKDTGEIELHQPLPAIKRHGEQVTRVGRTRIVDQNRGAKSLAEEFVEARSDRFRIREVDGAIGNAAATG